MIKRIYLVILVMLFAAPGLLAQAPSVFIEDVEADPGEILVPVYMQNFENLSNFDLFIKIDTEVLEFISIENMAFGTALWGATYDEAAQAIKIVMMNGGGVSLEDGKLLDLKLNYSGGFVTEITFDDELSVFYNSTLGTIDDVAFDGGLVIPIGYAGKVSMTTVMSLVNGNVIMPVYFEGEGFTAVSSFTLNIAIDQTQLEFQAATLAEDFPGSMTANEEDGEIRIIWTGDAVDFSELEEPAHVLDIALIYKGGGPAELRFKGTSQVTANLGTLSTEFVNGLVMLSVDDDALLRINNTYAYVERTIDETVNPPLITLTPNEVSVTVFAEDIESEIASVNLVIGFDNLNLSYERFVAHQLDQWNVNSVGNRIFVVRNSTTGDAIEDGELITLVFTYADPLRAALQAGDEVHMISPITFRGGTDLMTEFLASVPVGFENGSITVTNKKFELTLLAEPEEGGEVVGAGEYILGEIAEVDAIANLGYEFVNWTLPDGTLVSEMAANEIPITADLTLVANFALIDYTLTLIANPEEGGTVTGAGVYNYGDVVSVDAVPAIGYAFVNWTDEDGEVVSADPANDIPMPAMNVTLTANFEPMEFTLTLLADPEEGGEVVGGGVYKYGELVSVDAIPAAGYAFVNWTDELGAVFATDAANEIPMPAMDLTLTANFMQADFTLTLLADPEEGGEVSGAGVYTFGDEVEISAVANAGYEFVNWTDEDGVEVYTTEDVTFEMPANDLTLVAVFARRLSVTFNVDMTYVDGYYHPLTFNPASDVVYVTGNILGWQQPGADPDNQTMTVTANPMVYTKTLYLDPGEYAYKYFLNAGWDNGEWQGGDDRFFTLVDEDLVLNDWFGARTDPTNVSKPEPVSMKLYPNPARSILNIESGSEILEIRMMDMLGQVVFTTPVNEYRTELNVSMLKNGVYFVQVLTAEGFATHRVQVTK